MRIVLTGLRSLELEEVSRPEPLTGLRVLKVQYCAVCRTDAKMWSEGHRDLVFPRVPGHELVAMDENGDRFAVWPGTTCGRCSYCTDGRENLCEEMKIVGFHHDGGFADYILVPPDNLIPVPDSIPSPVACFAEPVGCVLNAVQRLALRRGKRVIIYGGGTLGLIAALVCSEKGAAPLIIEKNEEKIDKSTPFLNEAGIPCLKDTTESEFDAVLNACADPVAFSLGLVKLARGGRFSFFSGLKKNESIETNLVNLMHYKEGEFYGAYGLTRENMAEAMGVIDRNQSLFEKLIEEIVSPDRTPGLMPEVLAGRVFRYLLDFTGKDSGKMAADSAYPSRGQSPEQSPFPPPAEFDSRYSGLSRDCLRIIEGIEPVGQALRPAAQAKIDNKTKPLGALGRLEELAIQLCLIQNTLNPRADRKSLLVFAGDHGITEEGVSAYPSEVTGQMVKNFLDGGAAINVLCRHHNINIHVVDMGVNARFPEHPRLFRKKVRRGTRNFAVEEAMTIEEASLSLERGMAVFEATCSSEPMDIIGLGEMGIGNTTSASAIISTVTGISPAEATGRGTGLDTKGMEHKAGIIERALGFHRPDPENGLEILRKIGGYEIGGIAGAILAASSRRVAIVLDGVISTAAGLVAFQIDPRIGGYLIAGHRSVEKAQQAALDFMGIEPVIDLDMRLGEGTGAALAMDIVDAACRVMREMASFEEAGVSKK
ncbi:MAG: nicotinate-nucleotide--dimethylbenzimidazole phosphoribosyltransferase [Deltaproteobacteria bacterium]|nr:nicotinate-nucleotide--dimethylbenzimidazole phosphoribosyltransferase [Deltaproteobacteria bacterium]